MAFWPSSRPKADTSPTPVKSTVTPVPSAAVMAAWAAGVAMATIMSTSCWTNPLQISAAWAGSPPAF